MGRLLSAGYDKKSSVASRFFQSRSFEMLKIYGKDGMKCTDLYANLRMKGDLIWFSRNPTRFRKIFMNLESMALGYVSKLTKPHESSLSHVNDCV